MRGAVSAGPGLYISVGMDSIGGVDVSLALKQPVWAHGGN